jgi:Cell wall-active antibiotics response 4TMS YvqF
VGLVDGTLETRNGLRVRRNFSISGDTATFGLQSEGSNISFGLGGPAHWDLTLNPTVPMALEIKLGAGEADLKLDQLNVTQLNVDVGVGTATITLPENGQYRAEVKGGIGQTKLIIPKGLAVRIRATAGLGNVVLPANLLREGDAYLTPNYNNAESRVELQLQQGIGQVLVEMK